ncbi:MAG TPA: hypothetical protein VKA34_02130, partial [Balneolales bacterium]|nr:hypothetical protein [Balneolales bacterium]
GLICMLQTQSLFAQLDSTLVIYEHRSSYTSDVYANGLGMSGVTLAHSTASMYSNPATLSFLRRPRSITFDHYYDASNAVRYVNFSSLLINTHRQTFALGLSLRNSGYRGLEKGLGFFSRVPSDIRFHQMDITMGYSMLVLSNLSIGALFQVSDGTIKRTTLPKSHETTASVGFGLFYSPTPAIEYGIALNGIGNNLEYVDDYSTQKINVVQRHQTLALGISMHYPYTSLYSRPYVNLSASNEKIFGIKGIWYKAGLEVLPIHQIGLRTGYIYSPNFQGFTVGFGINFRSLHLDYALSPKANSLHQFQQFSISVII